MKVGDVVMIRTNSLAANMTAFSAFHGRNLLVTEILPPILERHGRWIVVDDARGFHENDLVIVGHPCPMGGVND